jgi:L-iditol 2-dehydrogenase
LGETLENLNTFNENVIELGTPFAVWPIISCLNCKYCNNKQYNLYTDITKIGSTVDSPSAELVMILEILLVIYSISLPAGLSNEEAALIDALTCCINGFSQMGRKSAKAR